MNEQKLTSGPLLKSLILFSLPMILGNLLQQFYNIADTWVVGQFLGIHALGAVGSAFSLMVFLTSILLGLCMGSGVLFSFYAGQGDMQKLRQSLCASAFLVSLVSVVLLIGSLLCRRFLPLWLSLPAETSMIFDQYIGIIFWGIPFTALYNYFAALMRALGDSKTPLLFLGLSAVLNIALDLLFVLVVHWGIAGAAWATLIAQMLSGVLIALYCWKKDDFVRSAFAHFLIDGRSLQECASYSLMTCLQQSVMNLGILMVQSLVNSFGSQVMAAFTAAVKIEAFAYMPLQEFGNAFSTFIAQNFGAGQTERIRSGRRQSFLLVAGAAILISVFILLQRHSLLLLFIKESETQILQIGENYLLTVAPFYWAIGFLFLFYAWYRSMGHPGVSVFLTILSLGTRVALAYVLSGIPAFGLQGIWWSVNLGWMLADLCGFLLFGKTKNKLKKKDRIGKVLEA